MEHSGGGIELLSGRPEPSPDAVRQELDKILASDAFRSAARSGSFLRYVVERALKDRPEHLKEYVIGTEVFGRKDSFDPRIDPVVRVEASKLRARLTAYYATEGDGDSIRIDFPKRGYVPVFRGADAGQADELPDHSDTPAAESITEIALPAPAARNNVIRGRSHARLLVLGLILLAVAATGAGYWYRAHAKAAASSSLPSIVVLPFLNLNGDRDGDYFADGLTDELIASLGTVPRLRVVARGSAFQFKGRNPDIRDLGRKLNVRAVLEGSVRREANRLRLIVHLDDAAEGYRLWSKTYDRDFGDVLALQQDLAQSLTNALGVEFAGAAPTVSRTSVDPEAYKAYLKGIYFWNKNSADSVRTAIGFFEQARAKEPDFAPIYTGLGRCYTALPVLTSTSSAEVIPKILEVAKKAVTLNPNLGEAHLQLGEVSLLEYNWAAAERELRLAVTLSPGDPVVHRWQSYFLTRVGRLPEALAETLTAQDLDPVSPYIVEGVAQSYRSLRRYSDAIRQYHASLALEPDFAMALQGLGMVYAYQARYGDAIENLERAARLQGGDSGKGELGYAYAMAGRRNDALAILNGLLEQSRHGSFHPIYIAQVYIGLGQRENAFRWLQEAVDQHEIILDLKGEQMFDPLRSDPRFQDLLRQMHLS